MDAKEDPAAPELTGAKLRDSPWIALGNPVVLIAVLILLSVFVLIGSAIFGIDRGVLTGMSRIDFARGLITYLFAIVTIGTAVVLVVSGLTGLDDPHNDRRFQRGKEILSLLLGVFGTIVGFYFGSEINRATDDMLRLASLRVGQEGQPPAVKFTVTTFVNGGKSPYEYALTLGNAARSSFEAVPDSGWIEKQVDPAAVPAGASIPIVIDVRDADGHSMRQSALIVKQP